MKTYTLTPLTGDVGRQHVEGFRTAIDIAREIAETQHTTVHVRNEADRARLGCGVPTNRGGRRGAYTTVEVTR
jgi:hypothetical protein